MTKARLIPLKLPGKVVRGRPITLDAAARKRFLEGLKRIDAAERAAWVGARECWIR